MRNCILPRTLETGRYNTERRSCRYFTEGHCLLELCVETGRIKTRPLCEQKRMKGEIKADIRDVLEGEMMGRCKPETENERSDIFTLVRRAK